uniref:Uncharacterized protein n=1 Tax=Candidatus Nitrotoga fabula TaxID=2182327 RepID=A0A2X0RF90_9PROT|nr:protein of unknown function [Candidatus Nitrotoga fabula]
MLGNSDFLLLCFLEKFGRVSQDLFWCFGENGYRRRHQASFVEFGKLKRQDLKSFIVIQGASLRQDGAVLNYALFDAGYSQKFFLKIVIIDFIYCGFKASQ